MAQSAIPDYPFASSAALEPPPEWQQLREHCPAAAVRMASGDAALLLTRYEDVRGLLSDSRFTRNLSAPDAARIARTERGGVFSNPAPYDEPREARADADPTVMAVASGSGHTRWRRLVARGFTARHAMTLQPRIQRIARDLVDDMLAVGPPADLIESLGFPLPVFVICELLGVSADDRDRFSYWSETMLSLTRYEQSEIDAAGGEFWAFMAAHVRSKRTEPGDDLISELVAVVDAEDGRMTETELIFTAQGLLVAGHETTANMIGKMVAMLLSDRGRWQALLQDRSLIASAVEEALRFDANPGFGLPRYISQDVEIAGHTVSQGTTVITSIAAANRDEQVFPNADRMDIGRTPNPHLTFGVGPHSCLGQSLARVELQTVLAVLLNRVPTLALAVPPEQLRRREGLIVGGLKELPVRW